MMQLEAKSKNHNFKAGVIRKRGRITLDRHIGQILPSSLKIEAHF
jgi:hypothetical protein